MRASFYHGGGGSQGARVSLSRAVFPLCRVPNLGGGRRGGVPQKSAGVGCCACVPPRDPPKPSPSSTSPRKGEGVLGKLLVPDLPYGCLWRVVEGRSILKRCQTLQCREEGAGPPCRSPGRVRAEEGMYLLQPPQRRGRESLLSWYSWSFFGSATVLLSQSSGLLHSGFK